MYFSCFTPNKTPNFERTKKEEKIEGRENQGSGTDCDVVTTRQLFFGAGLDNNI